MVARYSGMSASGYPTHPFNLFRRYTVVNTPRGSDRWRVGSKASNPRPSSSERLASRASFNSHERSSGVYSACGLGFNWTRSESSDGSDIALLAPAENECAAPALDYVAINLRPESV